MRKIKIILPVILGLALLVVPVMVLAENEPAPAFNYFGNESLSNTGLQEKTDIDKVIVSVIQWIMGIVGLICVIMIIYGGVTYATAAGVEERIETGKKILLWAIVGLIICILAFTLANTIVTAFTG